MGTKKDESYILIHASYYYQKLAFEIQEKACTAKSLDTPGNHRVGLYTNHL